MAGNLLWAHLLRKDATRTEIPSQTPPIAPQDKAGTSMRMLIHDTQVNLERFSARLDGLLNRVEDCRAEVVNANKLLDVERDRVLSEIHEIAHRCQSEMKAHVGTPAQASALDLVRVSQGSTEHSMQGLEKRIDALQALLQTQAHAMQSIQDQQNTLIGAILPLVPVLHGVPSQLDQIKAGVSDMVANAVSTMTSSVESVQSTLVAEIVHGHARSSNSSCSRRKRSNALVFGQVPLSSPLDNRGHEGRSLKRARTERVQLPRRLVEPLTNSADPPPRTPRQPLADLLFPPSGNNSRQRRLINSMSREYMRPSPITRPSDLDSTIPRSATDLARPSSKAIKMEEILAPNLTGIFSIDSSPVSTPPLSVKDAPQIHDGSPPKSMSLRDRLAQMSRIGRTETRRIIPLVPWSDEEE